MRKILILFMAMALFFMDIVISHADDSVIWRFAEKHEAGDLEPSDICYVNIHKDLLVMHWKTASDPESVEVYKINKKGKNSFCASKINSYVPSENDPTTFVITHDEYITGNRRNICYKITKNKLVIHDWITLKKEKALIDAAFPQNIIQKYIKR